MRGKLWLLISMSGLLFFPPFVMALSHCTVIELYDEKGKSRSNRRCWSFSALFPAELLVNTCIILHYEREPRVNCNLARF